MKTFKVLTFGNPDNPMFVDEYLLGSGIYEASIPKLHSSKETLQSMAERMGLVYDNPKAYITNLFQCRLIEVALNIKK